MKRINEIFYSLQGEGKYTGRPAVFVRFSGCNVKCQFCDTKHQKVNFEMSDREILEAVKKYNCGFVVFTGGEPGLQLDADLVKLLQDNGQYVAVETNGTCEIPANVDHITLSPKFEFVKGGELKIKKCDELKVVFNGENNMDLYENIIAFDKYIQPCAKGDELDASITQKAIKYCLDHPAWRLSLQTQKILNVQ